MNKSWTKHAFFLALSGVPPVAQAAALFTSSTFELAERGQARARKRLCLRCAQVPSLPSVSAGGAPNSRDLLAQSRAQTWRAHCPVSTSSTQLANSLPALGHPRLPAAGKCETRTLAVHKVALMLGWPIALSERHNPARLPASGWWETKTPARHETLALKVERVNLRAERISAFSPAHSLRGAVWPGRGIGRAERDEEGAGIRSESSEPQANGYSSEPRASEGFAKAAVGRGRLTRSGYTAQKRSNEQPATHPKALSRNNEQLEAAEHRANNRGLTPIKQAIKAPIKALLLATALTGCAVGPDYQTPAPFAFLEKAFVNSSTEAAATQDIAAFWRGFNDPQLDTLMEQALRANTSIRLAQARLREARANAGEIRAAGWPSFNVTSGVARVDPKDGTTQTGKDGAQNEYTAGLNVNWGLDFFGLTRRANESAAALVEANEAGIAAAQRLITAEVVSNYLTLRGLQQRLRVAQEALVNQQESLRIVEAREQFGRGTTLDVARARNLLETTAASVPVLQAAIERTLYRLATLTGQAPRAVSAALTEPQALPSLPTTDLAQLPVGTPEQLLQRRPDIRIAERQLAAATANVGVATADLFPSITLTGLLGFNSDRVGDLFDTVSRNTSLGAFLSWDVFNFGRLRARVDASEARTEQALISYEQTVQLALEETESALTQFNRSGQQAARLGNAAASADEAERLARIRFEAGASDFLSVLDAQRSALQARDSWVQAQVANVTALVDVYRALGGGWTVQ